MQKQKIHFIAIGGSAMHNLAIALHKKGYEVKGSDDEIFEPSRSNLKKHGLLPQKEGWFENNITPDIDAIILGMHARPDNPELKKAQKLGLKIFSYPEYLYEQSKDKIRIVVGGSHGKTTTTSMIMHALKENHIDFDYMVGAQLEGFETMVKLSEDAKYIILEGDEYLSSPIDRRPKFHLYHPHIAVITGIAWDHINVFPEYKGYVDQFKEFIKLIENKGTLFYCEDDKDLQKIVGDTKQQIDKISYNAHESQTTDGRTYLLEKDKQYKINVFGEHNLKNINAAKLVCEKIGISGEDFLLSMKNFKGASKRLQLLAENMHSSVFLDFAHSPSKLKATTEAVSMQFPNRKLIACMELHTFSSLNKNFLEHYAGTMKNADIPIVYYNLHTVKHKKLEELTDKAIKEGFGDNNLQVYTNSDRLIDYLKETNWENKTLLLMSSGNFNNTDLNELANSIIS